VPGEKRMTDSRRGLPELVVDRVERAAEPPVRSFGVQEWRDHDGRVAAYGVVEGETNRMVLPDLGTFRFTGQAEAPVWAEILPGVPEETVHDAFRRMVVPMVLQVRGWEVLHSSAVLAWGGVVAFCGVSGSGKSTLSYALGRRGHTLWADDSVAFDAEPHPVLARPLPFRIRFRSTSEEFFLGRGEGPHVDAAREVGVRSSGDAPLAVLFVLAARGVASSVRIDRLAPAEAFPAILEHAYCFSLTDPDRKRAMVGNYLQLVRRVPSFEVRLPPGFDHLDETVDRLGATAERAVAEATGRASAPSAPSSLGR
jgi:hypothetical protein